MGQTKGKCYNCGADKMLHRYGNYKCPRGGIEAPVGQQQEWMDAVFEDAQERKVRDAAPDLLEALKFSLTIIDRLSDDYSSIANKHANFTQGEFKKINQAIKKAE